MGHRSASEASIFSASQGITTFCGNKMIITVSTTAQHMSLFRASWIQSMPSHHRFLRSTLILSSHLCPYLPDGFFLSGLSTITPSAFFFSPIHATFPTYLTLLALIIRIYLVRRIFLEAPHYMYSPVSHYCHPLGPKYFPQHPILEHPKPYP